MQQTVVTGVVFGGLYAWQKWIWIVMNTHAVFDVTGLGILFAGLKLNPRGASLSTGSG